MSGARTLGSTINRSKFADVAHLSLDERSEIARQAMAILKSRGNPFRQQFARNADDVFCSRVHVDDLFQFERQVVRELISSYVAEPGRSSSVLPILGPRGAGKTHLLHCLKHQPDQQTQLYVTPGTIRVDRTSSDTGFLEYVLFQLLNVLLAGSEQRGTRPLDFVAETLTKQLVSKTILHRPREQWNELFSLSFVQRLMKSIGLPMRQIEQVVGKVLDQFHLSNQPVAEVLEQAGFDLDKLFAASEAYLKQELPFDLKSEYHREIWLRLAKYALLGEASFLADYLTDGFVEPEFAARPNHSTITLNMLQATSQLIAGSKIPIIVAFDQLEELLYGQSEDEVRRSSDAFFGGIVQLMSQVPGLTVLLLAEEGLWNRIVPKLSAHILDRIHEPIEIPEVGLVRGIKLKAPTLDQFKKVVDARVDQIIGNSDLASLLPSGFPFGHSFLNNLVKKESVVRLMLQACCNRLDELFAMNIVEADWNADPDYLTLPDDGVAETVIEKELVTEPATISMNSAMSQTEPGTIEHLTELWRQEVRQAERKLRPVGSLSAAAVDLQAGLEAWINWIAESPKSAWTATPTGASNPGIIGKHPSYGNISVVDWKFSGNPMRQAVGMWLGRGVGKPKDLEVKIEILSDTTLACNELVLFRPEDDCRITGRTASVLAEATSANKKVQVREVGFGIFCWLHVFPGWLSQATQAMVAAEVPVEEHRKRLSDVIDQSTEILFGLLLAESASEQRAVA